MFDAHTGINLVRETLEGLVEPRAASAAMFEALSAAGLDDFPSSPEALLAFVRTPLRSVVTGRVGAQIAGEVVERVEMVIGRSVQAPVVEREGPTTVEMPMGHGPVRVLVLSQNAALAVALRAALGGDAVGVGTAASLERAARLRPRLRPEVYILDATQPVADEVNLVATFLAGVPQDTACIVWGSEQPWGKHAQRAFEANAVGAIPVDRGDGVSPLLDLIRSRPRTPV